MRLNCAEYLGVALPALLERGADDASPPDSVIQFLVHDREDADYAYRFRDGALSVTAGLSDEVDLTLGFAAADLLAFSRHQLDIALAMREGRLSVHGDERLLLWLARRLAVRP